jgi:multidrug efflux pump subunit AcrB
MMLTAFAVVVGGLVILADPIFQGLAISLLFGAIASLIISPLAVPLIYYVVNAGKHPKPTTPATVKSEKCEVLL